MPVPRRRDGRPLRASAAAALALALAVWGVAPIGAGAQESGAARKSGWTAGVLEYVVPTAGYAYAGDWTAGIAPNVVRVSGTVALLWAMTDALTGEPGDEAYRCRAGCVFGLVATPIGYVWSVTGAVRAARRWTPEGAGLTMGWSPETSTVRVGVRVAF